MRTPVAINIFRSGNARLAHELRIARTILLLWATLSFGLPLLIWLAGLGDASGLGRSFLTEARFFGFPLHYWLIGQGCTLGYIGLCKLYCTLWTRKLPHH